MGEFEITAVKRVIELRMPVDVVNEHIDQGWVLLNVFSEEIPSDIGSSHITVYVLGWTSDSEPAR